MNWTLSNLKSHHQEHEEARHRLGENVHKLISRSGRVLYVEERNFYRSVQGRQTAQFLRRKKKQARKLEKAPLKHGLSGTYVSP